MLAAYEWLLGQDLESIAPAALAARTPSPVALQAEIVASFPLSFMAANAEIETSAKGATPERVERRLRALQCNWPDLSARLRKSLPAAETVRCWLEAAGAAATISAIGISTEKHAADFARARLIRRRFTALDVLHDLGWLGMAANAFNKGRKT
jgi:glycerol-1-phosphate dehydrogenase [NAD(P)+]